MNSLFDLSGKIALVTGISRGPGQYMARALAKAGVHIAGCNVRKPALDVTWGRLEHNTRDEPEGSFFVAQAVARGMTQRGYGRIINIASFTTLAGYAGLALYGAS